MYDGSINISTKIDTSGFNKGTKNMTASLSGFLSSVRRFGQALITAFGFAAIFNFIKNIVSSFNVAASSIGSSVNELTSSLQTLKGTFVTLILTALAPIIPYIVQFVNWLSRALAIVTAFISALFGIKIVTGQMANGLGAVTGGMGKLAKETKKANKELNGQLAAFDQLNVLTTAEEPEAPTPPTGGGGGLPLLPELDGLPDITDKVQAFKDKFLAFIQPVIDAALRLYDALKPLGQTIWEGLKWAWDNILVPIGEWAVTDLIPAFLDLLAAGADTLNIALVTLAPYAEDFFNDFLKPLGEFVGSAIIAFLGMLTQKLGELGVWIKENPAKFANFIKILGAIAIVIGIVAAALFLWLNPAYLVVAAIVAIIAILLNWGKVWEWIKLVAGEVWKDIKKVWQGVALWFRSTVIDPLVMFFSNLWKSIVNGLYETGVKISTLMKGIISGLTNQLLAIQNAFSNVFRGIADFVKSQINNIIDFINQMIANVVNGINSIINALNVVGRLLPGFSAIGNIIAPQIPRLATGAVIPPNSEFLAVLGDQTSGRNIETPESLLRQIVREETGGGGGEITIRFEGSLSALVRELKPYIDKETTRKGASLIVGVS